MRTTLLTPGGGLPSRLRNDRLLAPTRWVSAAVVPVLVAAFVVLYLLPDRSMQLWGWMICPSMTALVMGGGYLAGAYFFTRTARAREWHRVGMGFVATTVFSTLLLATTILHWDSFNHDHVSFWAWLVLYVATPVLLPVLWVRNHRTDPGRPRPHDVTVPRPLRAVVGAGGTLQLAVAVFMFGWPDTVGEVWPWGTDALAMRTLSAFVAFPAVTWLLFWFDSRWSSFRITQHTATIGLFLIAVGTVRDKGSFVADGAHLLYLAAVLTGVALNVALYVAMEGRARRQAPDQPARGAEHLSRTVAPRRSLAAAGQVAAAT